jgi:hypothetical protein
MTAATLLRADEVIEQSNRQYQSCVRAHDPQKPLARVI